MTGGLASGVAPPESATTAGAVRTSSDAFAGVETAATAASEMAESIAEINRQLVSASEVVGAAAEEAQSTNDVIVGLAQFTPDIFASNPVIGSGVPAIFRCVPK